MHFTSLPSSHGIGNIGASAHQFIDEMDEMGLSVWQFLPTGPTGYAHSPYQPLSVFAGNEMLIDLDGLIKEGLLGPDEAVSLEVMPEERVDYARVIPAKRKLVQTAAQRFAKTASAELRTEYERFLDTCLQDWLADYSLFRIIKSQHDERPWWGWTTTLATRDPAALASVRAECARQIEWLQIQQFFFDRQWKWLQRYANDRQVCLFGDMPIYVALDSADAWSHPELLQIDEAGQPAHVAGAPPDQFTPDGQLWGNPLYDWEHHEERGFRWWIDRVRCAAERFDLVRLDHFRGFQAFWSVPFGETTARNGTWEPGPGDRLFQAMEEALGALPIVAENLGDITKEVEALRLRHNIPGMKVLQFAVDEAAFDPQKIETDCVCYTGTHDCDTTYGWFHGSRRTGNAWSANRKTRRNALKHTGGKPQSIHLDMTRLAFSTPAVIAIAPMQDFLGLSSEARLNTPGTTSGNWDWRLQHGQLTAKVREQVRSLVETSARA